MTPFQHPTGYQHVYDISVLPEIGGKLRVVYDGRLFLIEEVVLGKYFIMASNESPQEVIVVERTDYETFDEIFREVLPQGGNSPLNKSKMIVQAMRKILANELNFTDRSYVIMQSKINEN